MTSYLTDNNQYNGGYNMAKKSARKETLVTESDVVIPDVTVEEAINEMSQLDILDWQKFHSLSVVSNVAEEADEDDGPREVESDLTREMITLISEVEAITISDLLATLHADSDQLGKVIMELGKSGYAIHIASDGWLYFGMAKIYEVLTAKQTVVVQKIGRKQEVLDLLMTGKHYKIPDLAKILGISDRNVSSQLSYLRADGKAIATDARGYKFLEK
jgi:biotin operon repressor